MLRNGFYKGAGECVTFEMYVVTDFRRENVFRNGFYKGECVT